MADRAVEGSIHDPLAQNQSLDQRFVACLAPIRRSRSHLGRQPEASCGCEVTPKSVPLARAASEAVCPIRARWGRRPSPLTANEEYMLPP